MPRGKPNKRYTPEFKQMVIETMQKERLSYQDFYQVLYKAGLSRILMETIVSTIRPEDEQSNAGAYIKSFWAYGIFGWVNEWISWGMPESGDEMDAMLKAMQPGGSNP